MNAKTFNVCSSRTGYVIKYSNCPIQWASKLQTEISLSKTEDEFIALSKETRELLLMREMIKKLSIYFKLPKINILTKFTVFEDNTCAEELAQTTKYRPQTKKT